MTQKIFNILSQINREGIDNGNWGLVDCDFDTKSYFGTEEYLIFEDQKVLYLYVDVNDTYSFIKTETADFMLTVKNENLPDTTALMLWKL